MKGVLAFIGLCWLIIKGYELYQTYRKEEAEKDGKG